MNGSQRLVDLLRAFRNNRELAIREVDVVVEVGRDPAGRDDRHLRSVLAPRRRTLPRKFTNEVQYQVQAMQNDWAI